VRQIKEAYRLIYRAKLNLQQAVEQIRATLVGSPEVEELLTFVTTSSRGIIK
jgi:UDP-N-acetylglucosamine acyltransferase